jgi:hypothetical protein
MSDKICSRCNTSARYKNGHCIQCNKQYNDKYRQDNIEELKDYRINNAAIISERNKEYYQENKDKVGVRHRQGDLNVKIDVFNHYGGCKCALCPEVNIKCLTIDHIIGGGNKHRRELGIGRGVAFYRWLKKNIYPLGYRVLCINCQEKSSIIDRKCSSIKSAIRQRQASLLIKISTFNAYGGCKCTLCGIEDLDVLSIDHIDGSGSQHRKIMGNKSGIRMYRYLKRDGFPLKNILRVLCFNCQFKMAYVQA